MKHEMPLLPYDKGALAPAMSKETLEYHYGKHLQTYVDNLNKLIAGTEYENMSLEEIVEKSSGAVFNNAAQAWNHTFFFMQFTPEHKDMSESLVKIISYNFGSVESFKEQFIKAATTLFGSGWVWLAKDENGELSILSESNAGNPLQKGLTPVLTVDVWEHAYYIDYRNKRADYLNAIWNIIDWDVVEKLCCK